MTRALVSEKWQHWKLSLYDEVETITPFLSLFQGAVTDFGVGQAGALVRLFISSGGLNDTSLNIYPGTHLPGASVVRDTEAQKTITLGTAANAILQHSFWVPWEDVGDGFYLGFKNAASTDEMFYTIYHKRLWTP